MAYWQRATSLARKRRSSGQFSRRWPDMPQRLQAAGFGRGGPGGSDRNKVGEAVERQRPRCPPSKPPSPRRLILVTGTGSCPPHCPPSTSSLPTTARVITRAARRSSVVLPIGRRPSRRPFSLPVAARPGAPSPRQSPPVAPSSSPAVTHLFAACHAVHPAGRRTRERRRERRGGRVGERRREGETGSEEEGDGSGIDMWGPREPTFY
ncbi:hypothetical protein OsJ_19623 [Oryza sativa Japonica Group]|nr:hypothetical protein OsJ_19623 [Oryza sativa Japonica Group]